MAKVTNVNIVPHTGTDVASGLYELATALLANGYTLVACGTGTSGVRRTSGALSLAEWHGNNNAWQILTRGSVWITFQRTGAGNVVYEIGVVAPSTTGDADSYDTQATAANKNTYTIAVSGTTRAHVITYNADCNAAGIRSFALIYTDGTSTPRGHFYLEAFEDGTFSPSNPAPYAVSGANSGNTFVYNGGAWSWWHSPTSVWVPASNFAIPGNSSFYMGAYSPSAGVDQWDGEDVGLPIFFGRPTGGLQPGYVGAAAHLRCACVGRSYPSTMELASNAFCYIGAAASGSCLQPWENGTTPL
jgi:hypothetical protein